MELKRQGCALPWCPNLQTHFQSARRIQTICFAHSIKTLKHPNIKDPDFLSLSTITTMKLYCLKTTKYLHHTETWLCWLRWAG